MSGQRKNRLQHCSSPYLLQHADNPVDWYPWGQEAVTEARREDKPIFLSIGYATCHWCHVMARESFEDPDTAALLNMHFVPVKVDREERPDVDTLYMNAVQLMIGSGGWPLSVFLTPELVPFFGGTYFPPEERYGMPAFRSILQKVAEAWQMRRSEITQHTEHTTEVLKQSVHMSQRSDRPLSDQGSLDAACGELRRSFDSEWGGFGSAPKFPPHGALGVLLRQYADTAENDALNMAELTLTRMAQGGLYDHIGGGFHRYATDREWSMPHFEKMLYDNALLANNYLEAYQLTGKTFYRDTAVEVLDYLQRDMRTGEGGFCAGEDAESDGEEGAFYMWRADQIDAALAPPDAALFKAYYGVNNSDATTLNIQQPLDSLAADSALTPDEISERLESCRSRLFQAREQRPRPQRDDKVVAAWNGLVISALAKGYWVTQEVRFREAAVKAARFVQHELLLDGKLARSWRAGEVSGIPGYLDDYAALANAMLDLYQATFCVEWIESAETLIDLMKNHFYEPSEGGFYYTGSEHTHLLTAMKSGMDVPLPAGDTLAASALLKLGYLKTDSDMLDLGEQVLQNRAGVAAEQPEAYMFTFSAIRFATGPTPQIVVVGEADDARTETLFDTLRKGFLPNSVVCFRDVTNREKRTLEERIPLAAGKESVDGGPAVHVCENFSCRAPAVDADQLCKTLGISPRRCG